MTTAIPELHFQAPLFEEPGRRIVRATDADAFDLGRRLTNAFHSYIDWSDRPSRKLYWILWDGDRPVGVWGLVTAWVRPKAVAA